MSNYRESIQSLESVGTGTQVLPIPDSTSVLSVSGDTPATTSVDFEDTMESISQDSVSYSAPQKVIVRTYRLRK